MLALQTTLFASIVLVIASTVVLIVGIIIAFWRHNPLFPIFPYAFACVGRFWMAMFRTNNRRWCTVFALTIVSFGWAVERQLSRPILSHDAKRLVQQAERSGLGQRIENFVWKGEFKTHDQLPKEKKWRNLGKMEHKPWFSWWGIFLILFLTTVVYFPIAFREEVRAVFRRRTGGKHVGESARRYIGERIGLGQHEATTTPPPPPPPTPPPGTTQQKPRGFLGSIIKGEIIAEIINDLIREIFRIGRR